MDDALTTSGSGADSPGMDPLSAVVVSTCRSSGSARSPEPCAPAGVRADDVLERMDPDLLAQEIAAGHVGERGQAIYAKRMKRSQDLRENEAKIANLTAEGRAGPKLTEAQEKRDVLVQGAKAAYERLLPLNGDFNRGATKEMVAVGKTVSAYGYASTVEENEMRAERITVDGKTIEMR